MLLYRIAHKSGKLDLGNRFVSIRILKDAIEKHNKISLLHETPTFLKCRIFRIARLFGGPWIGPYPVVSIKIERLNTSTILHYDFYWPEYYASAFYSTLFGIIIGNFEYQSINIYKAVMVGFLAFLSCLFITSLCLFIDIKYYSKILLKEFAKL
jgi:hypothetical protein